MRYVVLIYADEADWEAAGPEDVARYQRAHTAFAEAVAARAELLASDALHVAATATTMRHRDGAWTLTDGPFAETVEQLGGFYAIDVPDLDTLLSLCELLPTEYALELRPVADMSGDPSTD